MIEPRGLRWSRQRVLRAMAIVIILVLGAGYALPGLSQRVDGRWAPHATSFIALGISFVLAMLLARLRIE